MKINLTGTFKKDYKSLPPEIKAKTKKQLRFLAENPKHPSLKIRKIEGTHGFLEFYADRSCRAVFTLEGEVLVLRHIGPHNIIEKV